LAFALAGGEPTPDQVTAAALVMARLVDTSLLTRLDDDLFWVHRWTAQGLAARCDSERHHDRCRRAGLYRLWRVEHVSHSIEDGMEAIRNLLEGRDHDRAAGEALGVIGAMKRFGQLTGVVGFGAEVVQQLPPEHGKYARICDEEAEACVALGLTSRARETYEGLVRAYAERTEKEPDRADYQRDLSVSFVKLGDLQQAMGDSEAARDLFVKSLQISQRLAAAEPDRADYQRDLSVSFNKLGDLQQAMGEGEAARDLF
ncbi:MAG: hypothetical protein GY842_13020, partial [bacterium]|nr:hypothetical protein [bacterium]